MRSFGFSTYFIPIVWKLKRRKSPICKFKLDSVELRVPTPSNESIDSDDEFPTIAAPTIAAPTIAAPSVTFPNSVYQTDTSNNIPTTVGFQVSDISMLFYLVILI